MSPKPSRALLYCAFLLLYSIPLPGADAINIGIIGDQTLTSDIQASYGVLRRGVAELSRQNIQVVLHVGDLVESSRSPEEIRVLFNQASGILDGLPVPWFLTAGDHDVNPPKYQQDSSDRSREQLFQELYGGRVPTFRAHPYYSFDVGGYHFIALYSHQALHCDPRWGDIFLARIYDDQFTFLENDLRDHKTAKGIIVFIHQPLWYHASGWRRVHELLRQYPVAAVVSGHFHYDQDSGTTDGIRYITVGATGGDTKHGSRDAGDVQHVTVLNLSNSQVSNVKLISLTDSQPLTLTPSVDMDRVQALHVQLGELSDFATKNPVFVKNGELLSSCTNGTPATVAISQIGDPIDLPLDVNITFSTEPEGLATLSSPAFGLGECQRVVNNTECVLKRSARVRSSNYSTVKFNDLPPPLWTTGLSPSSTGPQPGLVLNFHIKTMFDGASGKLFLEKDVSTKVQACP